MPLPDFTRQEMPPLERLRRALWYAMEQALEAKGHAEHAHQAVLFALQRIEVATRALDELHPPADD